MTSQNKNELEIAIYVFVFVENFFHMLNTSRALYNINIFNCALLVTQLLGIAL